ncbi:MAG TPA: FkbM family methyltransferase [Alphaproteobacteria bacterium]
MIRRPKTLAKMFLDRRPHRGARDFKFRPRRRQMGIEVVNVVARNGAFNTPVYLRPGTSDLESFEQVFLAGSYNVNQIPHRHAIARLYRSMQEPLVIDLGANIGLASLYFRKSWPRARIVAVEPDSDNINMLRRNAPDVTAVHAAIGSERGRMTIVNPEDEAWGYRTESASDGAIDAITVADILDSNSNSQPFICKIDIEGAEKELFSKNTEWLSSFPVVIMEVHDWLLTGCATARNFLRAVADLDRDFVLVGENVWSIANRRECAIFPCAGDSDSRRHEDSAQLPLNGN